MQFLRSSASATVWRAGVASSASCGPAAAQGKKPGEPQPLTAEQMAFAQLTQGIHW